MKIYTRTGDTGQSSLYRGGRVPKDDPRLEAYGSLDELNSALGLALAHMPPDPLAEQVLGVQQALFKLGAQLACRSPEPPAWHIEQTEIDALEQAIDGMEAELPPLRSFILPGGAPAGAAMHLARTVARRAERRITSLAHQEAIDPLILRYINRLSDYLFVLARRLNARAGRVEPPLGL